MITVSNKTCIVVSLSVWNVRELENMCPAESKYFRFLVFSWSCRSFVSREFPKWTEMADCASAPKKIEDYLKRCPGRSATISDIANGTGVPVQLLHKLLRQLKQKKVVFQDKQTPTKWTLCDQVVIQFRFSRLCCEIARGTREFCFPVN